MKKRPRKSNRLLTSAVPNGTVKPIRKHSGAVDLRIEQLENRVTPVARAFTQGLDTGGLAANTTSLDVTFSEAVLNANLASSYELRRAGSDGILGTGDDQIVSATPSYAGVTATLSFGYQQNDLF